ncbi:MAG: type ISP restriction/modification enzyme, partial [Dolichospermum sp.]
KFIRFAQYQIENNSHNAGIIGFITNHSYLNGLIHRGMREELLRYFDTLYIMDLHGNSLLKETTPDGNIDQNVFDIQQGVSILIAMREKSRPDYGSTAYKSRDGVQEMAKVLYYDLWGSREDKYNFLESASLDNINWIEVQPTEPNYFFAPKNFDLATEYNEGWNITDIFPVNSTGVKTHRDHFVIDFDLEELHKRIVDFRDLSIDDENIGNIYELRDTRDWKISIKRRSLSNNKDWKYYFTTCLYRPFDTRFYYHHQDVVELPRNEVMQNMVSSENLGLVLCRQQSQPGGWYLVSVTNQIIECCAISNKT